MANRTPARNASSAVLQVRDLHVYYGQSHALQGVDLTLEAGVHAVVGRNGMGKTTLCNTIMGLLPARRGSIRFLGEELIGQPPYKIASKGVGYTPQGRRLWPSLTVDEHLRLSDTGGGAWTIERIYDTFPRLAERQRNGGAQLSGGEQQMLAISRALLQDPRLLVLDEPTEGLAPVIVDQVEELLVRLTEESDVAILLIEQNISVATSIAKDVAIMVNGKISRVMPAAQLANDRALQERLLGVGRHSHEDVDLPAWEPAAEVPQAQPEAQEPAEELAKPPSPSLVYVPPTRWSAARWSEGGEAAPTDTPVSRPPERVRPFDTKPEPLFKEPLTPLESLVGGDVYVVGTFDTKGAELSYIRDCITAHIWLHPITRGDPQRFLIQIVGPPCGPWRMPLKTGSPASAVLAGSFLRRGPAGRHLPRLQCAVFPLACPR